MNGMSDVKNTQEEAGVEPVWDRSREARDELPPPGTNGGLTGIAGVDWLFFGAVATISIAIGIVNALSAAQEIAWRGGVYDVRTPLLWEMTSIATIIAVAPVLFIAVRRMRLTPKLLVRIALAISAIAAFTVLHIAGMVGLRKMAMWAVGGSYEFRFSMGTVIYEFRKDLLTCLLIGSASWLIDSRREAQRLQPTVSGPSIDQPPHMVWLRDGTTRIRIEPGDILWISSAGNYVEYIMADGVNHLVRGTLAATENQLRRFNLARVHRTRLVNLGRVTGVEMKSSGDFALTFDTGQSLQGSRRYRTAVEALDRTVS